MGWHLLCDESELIDGEGREFVVEGSVIAVFKKGESLFAVDGMCAHQGGPIAQGQLDGNCVTCPWHGWQYDVSSGCNVLSGKPMLHSFPTQVREGKLWIELE